MNGNHVRVMKFGGTSVGSPDRLERVLEIVADAWQEWPLVVVVSAMGKTTNKLLAIEAIAVLLALLVAGLAAAWFIRRSLRPLRVVAATASEVARLPLEHGDVAIPARVPAPVPTTTP